MDLDRGTLARIDRRILSGIGTNERYQIVRASISAAMWSTWKRHCAAVRVSMGRGVAGLIAHELGTVIAQDEDDGSVFAAELRRNLGAQVTNLDAGERRIIEWERAFRGFERRLRAMDRRIQIEQSPLTSTSKAGRNEPRPWGANIKRISG